MARKLSTYRAKRDFEASPEPAGERPPARRRKRPRAQQAPRFVVHEHSARRLHWDLRLERDGALASWAVPRGIPDDPAHNRKAIRTEDHPLEYLDFKGEIPAGNYGAGEMRIWDSGDYECEKWRDDEVIVTFHGRRLQGRYALFRAGREPRDWMIHRMDAPADPTAQPMPEGLVPMLARAGSLPSDEQNWAYEVKWDGVRALAYSEPGHLRLTSRNLREITATYPELRALNRELGSRSAILDGEIVAFDDRGRPSFERLQERINVSSAELARRRARDVPAVYMIFDVLFLDGHTVMSLPYSERRARLEQLGLSGASWQTPSVHRDGDGAALLAATAEQGLEGLVAKRLDSRYEPGRRTGAWIKVKNKRGQELVIGGWVPGAGRRTDRVGALLLGYYDEAGGLRYAGRVGSGFSERSLKELGTQLGKLRRDRSPFVSGRVPRGAIFVEPRLVAEVEFSEWTADGLLRQPVYKGLRDDKDPRDVVREPTPDPRAGRKPAGAPGGRGGAARGRGAPARGRARTAKSSADATGPLPESAAGLFEEARATAGGIEVRVGGRELKLTNYDKVLFPSTGFTKGDLIEYYARVAPTLIAHLSGRPLTLKRYPNGVEGEYFYEKNCPKHRPPWVQTAAIAGERSKRIDYCLVEDVATLVWLGNLADIELHTSLSRASEIDRPTMVVFDLDPGEPAGLLQCCEVALVLKGMFEGLGLQACVKTSGSKGVQVYVPLNGETSYTQTKGFARGVAELLAREMPDLVVARMTKGARAGKVFVDWSQNDRHKTTVSVYSVRAREHPTVSTPLAWDEVSSAHKAGDAGALAFEPAAVLERIARDGDLFAPTLGVVQQLPPD